MPSTSAGRAAARRSWSPPIQRSAARSARRPPAARRIWSPAPTALTLKAWAAWTIRITAGVERPRPLGGGLIGFRGNGSRELPPFTTLRGTDLIWTNTGGLFSIDSGLWTLGVSSAAKRGKRHMGRGVHTFAGQCERQLDDRLEALSGGGTLRS